MTPDLSRRDDRHFDACPEIVMLIGPLAHVLDIDPEHAQAARRLVARGMHDRARRIALCPPVGRRPSDLVFFPRKPCKSRACPSCSERRAQRFAIQMRERIDTFANPVAVLIASPTRSAFDLRETLETMRADLLKVRRRRWFERACTAGVLAVECPPTADARRWNVHAHGALDIDPAQLDEFRASARGEWSELRGAGAVFAFEELRSGAAIAHYGLKVGAEKSWAPTQLSARALSHVDTALRSKRLLISWGAR